MFEIMIQRAVTPPALPSTAQFKQWANAVLQNYMAHAELTIRIVSKEEMKLLNATYRKKDYPTNVLAFPFEIPKDLKLDIPILGDVVICAEVIAEEAEAQQKSLHAHWAHMVVHGTLHLLGLDHKTKAEAERMENEEIKILNDLGVANPYELAEKKND